MQQHVQGGMYVLWLVVFWELGEVSVITLSPRTLGTDNCAPTSASLPTHISDCS